MTTDTDSMNRGEAIQQGLAFLRGELRRPTVGQMVRAADAIETALSPAQSEAGEREQIVAWLRGEVTTDYTDPQYDIGRNLADAIEQGRHLSTPPKDSEAATPASNEAHRLADLLDEITDDPSAATNGGDEASALVARLTRPIISIENRTQQEAFDIMCDRIRVALGAKPCE